MNSPASPTSRASAEFDSLEYWRTRHEQYGLNPQGVGNAVLDVGENERIYKAIDQYVGKISAALGLGPSKRVLDLGCGIGMLADAFLRTGCSYTGIDISPKAIEIARQKYPAGRFEVGNIAALPFDGPFDLVIERTVFIHLVEDAYWRSVIKEVRRVLAPNGVFMLIDHIPARVEEAPVGATHVKFRLREDYASALGENGLEFSAERRHQIGTSVDLNANTHIVTHRVAK